MNGLIIYKGKYGATKQYAEWIAEETKMEISSSETVTNSKLEKVNPIVICSSVYIGKLLVHRWLRKNVKMLYGKKLIFAIICGTPASDREGQQKIARDNLHDTLFKDSSIYFLPGRLIFQKLLWKDKMLMKIGSRLEKNPVKKEAMRSDLDGVKKENLKPIIDKIKTAMQ